MVFAPVLETTMPPAAPIIYMPLESKVRELPSRILLSRYLLCRGFRVVLGYNQTIVSGSRWFPKGIYLIKGLNAVQRRMAAIFREHGHRVLAIDEEALGLSDEWFIAKNVDPEITSLVDEVYCQGPRQRRALADRFNFTDQQLALTGNSRVDFLLPPLKAIFEAEVRDIKGRHGKFVLINTNSGSVNNLWGDPRRYLGLLVEVGWYDPENPDDKALVDEHLAHDRGNLETLKSLIELLAERRPDISVVVRPHPSERSKIWQDVAIDLPSVTVVTDTNAPPWLDAASLVVTTGCTTGLEAALLNTPAISVNVEPEGHRFSSFFVANEVNPVTRSIEDSLDWITGHWEGTVDLTSMEAEARRNLLTDHLEISGSGFATAKIAASIGDRLSGTPSTDRAVTISDEHEAYLRGHVKRVQWDKGAFDASEITSWMALFDQYLEEESRFDLRDISWSAFELTAAG
jgi:surface carbohydrate biosynthesis protein